VKVLFAMVDGGGNIPPQLAVAGALHRRGVEIQVVGHRGIRARVEAAGLPFEPFADGRDFDPTVQQSLASIMTKFVRVAADRRLGDCIAEVAQRHQADAIVVDMILAAGISAVMESRVPTVVLVHCFYRAVQDLASGPVGWMLRLRGSDPLVAEHRGLLQVVTARADLDPMRGTPPVRHAGVVWQGAPRAAEPAAVPRILVSLSTCAFAGQRRMLQNILDALAPLPVEATVTVGPAIDAAGLRVPQNATMHAWLDHDEVLATASLVVGHGGHSTAMRALSFGVPVIVMPANPMIDQKGVGAALEKAGAGILLPKHARPKRIRTAVETVLRDPGFRRAADWFGQGIRQRNGAEVAADAIEEFVRNKRLVGS
jgi:UDP:flavonoid glycosyltransferase YjiC (YdhE family)